MASSWVILILPLVFSCDVCRHRFVRIMNRSEEYSWDEVTKITEIESEIGLLVFFWQATEWLRTRTPGNRLSRTNTAMHRFVFFVFVFFVCVCVWFFFYCILLFIYFVISFSRKRKFTFCTFFLRRKKGGRRRIRVNSPTWGKRNCRTFHYLSGTSFQRRRRWSFRPMMQNKGTNYFLLCPRAQLLRQQTFRNEIEAILRATPLHVHNDACAVTSRRQHSRNEIQTAGVANVEKLT